jgi:hypothetical protein
VVWWTDGIGKACRGLVGGCTFCACCKWQRKAACLTWRSFIFRWLVEESLWWAEGVAMGVLAAICCYSPTVVMCVYVGGEVHVPSIWQLTAVDGWGGKGGGGSAHSAHPAYGDLQCRALPTWRSLSSAGLGESGCVWRLRGGLACTQGKCVGAS